MCCIGKVGRTFDHRWRKLLKVMIPFMKKVNEATPGNSAATLEHEVVGKLDFERAV